MRRHAFRLGSMALGLAALSGAIVLKAQQGAGAAGAARPVVPLTASSLLAHPELYLGQNVSVMATVEKTLSKTVFTLDQDPKKAAVKDVLVIAPSLLAMPALNSYVSVVGDAVKFDPADVARRLKGYTLDLSPELIERYRGMPVILATSVIDNKMADLAKKPVVPATPEETAFDNDVMKKITAAYAALRAAADGSKADEVKTTAAEMRKIFADTEAFFKKRNTADAIKWAQDGGKLVDDTDAAAAKGNWDAAKTAAGGINGLCGQCHTAHRERQDDGTFRVKG